MGLEELVLEILAWKLEDCEAAEQYCTEIGRQDAYMQLLDMYLNPQEGKDPMFKAAVHLLHNHGQSLDPLQLLEAWIAEMASYIKSLDQKLLVTDGLEGFYGRGRTARLGANPGEWASSLGSDFIQNSADENMDFASVHAYPDTLPKASFEEKVKYLSNWVDYHVNDSEHVLKK